MQLALRPGFAGADLTAGPTSVSRTNKVLIGTVAALSAGVIAVGPAVQHSAALEVQHAQQRAVELVAAVTDSPIAVYGDLINNTAYNVGTLLKQYAATPFPILSAIVGNQVGYLKQIFDFSAASTAFKTWWESGTKESAPGKTLLANVQSALSKGDLGLAYENFNRLTLFGLQNTVLTWVNGWLFSTSTTMGIPQRMAQNLSNALGAVFTTGTLVFGAFQSAYAPISGAVFELSRALGAVGSAVGAGNLAGAITALVNTPGAVANAFLNGFDYSSATNPWAGLLSPKDPACTGRCAGGGPISQMFITIARTIAAAIKNAAAPTTTTTAAAASLVSAAVAPAATSYTLSLGTNASASTPTEGTADAAANDTGAAAKSATVTKVVGTVNAPGTTKPTDAGKAADTATDTATDATTATAVAGSGATADGSTNASSDKAGSDQADGAKSASAQGDSTKAGPVKRGSSKKAAADSGAAQAGSAKSGSDKTVSTKTNSGKADAGKADAAKSDSGKTDSAKADSAKSGSAHRDSGKQGSGKHAAKHDSGSSS